MIVLTLLPGHATLADLEHVYWEEAAVRLDDSSRPAMQIAADRLATAAAGNAAIYGVNTGFGKLASVKIEAKDTATLQRNLILSHCCGVGAPISRRLARLVMTLKLLSLGRGASGVRLDLIDLLQAMLERGVTPIIPSQGSVGASGDLAPLAHMAAVMTGAGKAEYQGYILDGAEALAEAGLEPAVLGAKEGLALINGTQFSTALAIAGLFGAWRGAQASLVTSALSTDAVMCSTAPFQSEIHSLRGHRGQIDAAGALLKLLAGSDIRESHRHDDVRVQDPYCIRCQPQVTGAAMDILRMAATTLETEANAATDNPLVLVAAGEIVSGGNFHAEPVGFAADNCARHYRNRRDRSTPYSAHGGPCTGFNLPPFLTPNPGLSSGFMIAEVTAPALMSENKHLANPCVTDSTPTSTNQEDHVSMAAHGAQRLGPMIDNLSRVLGVELLCAAQGVEFRAPLATSPALMRVTRRLRSEIAALGEDRYLAPDLEGAADLVAAGRLAEVAGIPLPELAA